MARGAFWTIIVDDQPTAFRAPVREDLLPTLAQLHRQHPTAVIKWFQRGRLWETPGDAMDASKPPRRPGAWRPGGEHKDPRDQYKVPRDVKRARWASQAADGRGPWMKGDKPFNAERRTAAPTGTGHREPDAGGRPPRADRPTGDRPAWKPREDRPANAERRPPNAEGRPAWKPRGEGAPNAEGRPAWKPKSDRPTGDRPAWKPKGDGPFAARGEKPAWKPKGDRPTGDRPAWKPREDRAATADRRPPSGEGRPAWKPKGDRPANAEGRPRSSAPRGDWRSDRPVRDATPRAGGQAPPPAKKARTWRAGELPPADRKRKKGDD
jgi:hypothetical protein